MNYLIVNDGVIENIIVCDNDEIALQFDAVPTYDGARIGDPYTPPEPELTEVEQLRAQVADLQNQILTMRLGG